MRCTEKFIPTTTMVSTTTRSEWSLVYIHWPHTRMTLRVSTQQKLDEDRSMAKLEEIGGCAEVRDGKGVQNTYIIICTFLIYRVLHG